MGEESMANKMTDEVTKRLQASWSNWETMNQDDEASDEDVAEDEQEAVWIVPRNENMKQKKPWKWKNVGDKIESFQLATFLEKYMPPSNIVNCLISWVKFV